MKKLLLLITILISLSVCSYGQYTNAVGSLKQYSTCSLCNSTVRLIYNSFFLISTLPSDAVIQKVYPVFVASAVHDRANSTYSFAIPSVPQTSFNTPSDPTNTSYSSTEFYANTLTTTVLPASGTVMTFQLGNSLFQSNMLDDLEITAVGFAIYYTSATPTTSTQIPPPVSVPGGQGVAWMLPSNVDVANGNTDRGFASAIPAQNQSPQKGLIGLINKPNGEGVNGTLQINLPNGTIKNTCVTPWLNVPKLAINVPIVNGLIKFGNNQIISNDCLYPRMVYNITITDTQKNYIYGGNWYLPQNGDIVYDVGSMVETNFGGPITIQIPKGIISNPTQNQVITQPAGTSLNLVGTILINGVTFATAAGGVTYTGLLLTNPSLSQTLTQPGGTFLNFVGDIRVNGNSIGTGGGFLTSFNGRTGPAITPTTGDYTCAQVTGCVTTSTANYQIVAVNGVDLPAEHRISFSNRFSGTDTPGVGTNIDLLNTGVSSGTYTFPSSITVGLDGRISAIASSGTLPINVSQTVVTGSRSFGSTYQNTSGSALLATGYGTTSGSSTGSITCNVGPSTPSQQIWSNSVTATLSSGHAGFECIVPNTFFYSVTVTGAISGTPGLWVESVF